MFAILLKVLPCFERDFSFLPWLLDIHWITTSTCSALLKKLEYLYGLLPRLFQQDLSFLGVTPDEILGTKAFQ
ncbi:hypothetical protein IMY05_006G0012000 [Salix suchowensis]|nr:hypothetical protein IMY05_006G0012000 [Salix suchowensis]